MWQNTTGLKTHTLTVSKSVASPLPGVARLYLIIIAHNTAHVSQAHNELKFRTESAMQDQCKALMAMLHVFDPNEEDEEDKLRKVSSLLEFFKQKCKDLYQPFQCMAVGEKMVKSKHWSGIRQYIKDQSTKWGVKL